MHGEVHWGIKCMVTKSWRTEAEIICWQFTGDKPIETDLYSMVKEFCLGPVLQNWNIILKTMGATEWLPAGEWCEYISIPRKITLVEIQRMGSKQEKTDTEKAIRRQYQTRKNRSRTWTKVLMVQIEKEWQIWKTHNLAELQVLVSN